MSNFASFPPLIALICASLSLYGVPFFDKASAIVPDAAEPLLCRPLWYQLSMMSVQPPPAWLGSMSQNTVMGD